MVFSPKIDLGRFWTIPNVLSLFRLVLIVPIAILLWQDGPVEWLLGLVALVIISDWFDGRIARWTKTVSEWGKVIDPVADKFAAVMTVAALTFRPADPHLPLWFFWIGRGAGRRNSPRRSRCCTSLRTGRNECLGWEGCRSLVSTNRTQLNS